MAIPPHHERLSALDAAFLGVEDRCSHMHIGSVATFDAAALGPDGGLDPDRVRHLVEVALEMVPRYRQRVEQVPLLAHPVWVDDDAFNLSYHLRHTRLPMPGDDRQLKRLAGRLMSQQLDRGKPLWENWFVEGLEGTRFAIVSKLHHCMVDGVGSVELTTATMHTEPGEDPRLSQPVPAFVPRPAPSGRDLLLAELQHRSSGALGFLGASARALVSPREAAQAVSDTVEGIAEGVVAGIRQTSPTPFNVEIGPHRRFDWTAMSLDLLRRVKARLGGTLNDVVLTIVAGAVRHYLAAHGVRVEELDFRVMVPVNIRGDYGGAGNRVASLVVRIPVDEADPRLRLERVHQETEAAKHSHQVAATRVLEELSDWSMPALLSQSGRLAGLAQPFNLVVTNVPGPQFPLYFLGARMLQCFPLVPIFHNQALGIALFSYDRQLFWGFNADWDAVADLHDLVTAVDAELQQLVGLAGLAEEEAAPLARPA